MTKNELLKEALNVCVANDAIRYQMNSPFEQRGYVYATDGKVLMRVPADELEDSYKRDYTCPNASDVMRQTELCCGSLSMMALIDTDDPVVNIENWMIAGTQYQRVRKVTALLGLEGWIVKGYKAPHSAMVLINGNIEMLVMPTNDTGASITIKCDDCYKSNGINTEAGTLAFEAMKQKAAEEEKKKVEALGETYNKIYAVTLVKSAVMYVEAKSSREAMRIAEDRCSEIDDCDFDNVEVDSCESHPSEAADYMDTIYTEDKEYTYNEYVELE